MRLCIGREERREKIRRGFRREMHEKSNSHNTSCYVQFRNHRQMNIFILHECHGVDGQLVTFQERDEGAGVRHTESNLRYR